MILRTFFSIVLLCTAYVQAIAQNETIQDSLPEAITKTNDTVLQLAELGKSALNNPDVMVRTGAADKLQQELVTYLQTPGSFDVSLDSLSTLSVLYPTDSTFRLLTWQIYIHDDLYLQYGVLQTRNLKAFPLHDHSEEMMEPETQKLDADNWYGALYYKIYEYEPRKGEKNYALFGLDSYRYWNRRKIMDIMRLTPDGPVFDQPVIVNDSAGTAHNRFILEYSVMGAASVNYNNEENMVIFDHLIEAPGPADAGGLIYVSDGTYEGYKLIRGTWKWVSKLTITPVDEAPRPMGKQTEGPRDIMGRKRKSRS